MEKLRFKKTIKNNISGYLKDRKIIYENTFWYFNNVIFLGSLSSVDHLGRPKATALEG